jgi:hypothetical protein
MRALLAARAEAPQLGLEMRPELRIGNVANELARQLGNSADQLLILGVSEIKGLAQRFGELLAAAPRWPLLVVYREPEVQA